MKKLALICLSPLVLASVALAGGVNSPVYSHPNAKAPQPVYHPFTGLFVTAAIGGVVGQTEVKQNLMGESIAGDGAHGVEPDTFGFTFNEPVTSSESIEISESNVAGLGAIELSYQFNNGLVLALAGTAGFNNVDMKNTDIISESTEFDISNLESFNDSDVTTTVSVELENDFALLFKPGFVIHKNTMIYALVGPRWGNIETTVSTTFADEGSKGCIAGSCDYGWENTVTASSSHSAYELGITAGLGLRQVITKHFLIGIEYAYSHYGDLDSVHNDFNVTLPSELSQCNTLQNAACSALQLIADDTAQDIIVNTHTLMGTLSYRF